MKNQRDHARRLHRLVFTFLGLTTAATLVSGTTSLASAQSAYPGWSYTGSLNAPRRFHTSTLLQTGKVLVAAGFNNCSSSCTQLNSAELYDPTTGTWTLTGNLNKGRDFHTATLLLNGKVLVAGGSYVGFLNPAGSAELYDPASGTWSVTGNLNKPREFHTATLLPNGKVLIAGGYDGGLISSAELYDPATGTWSFTGSLNKARLGTATLLLNGKVLVAGGDDVAGEGNSAELYDPASGTWTNTGSLNHLHFGTAILLANGNVLFAGGGSTIGSSAELYDPVTATWSFTGNLAYSRFAHTVTLLSNGKVLATAGVSNEPFGYVSNSAELYDVDTGKWKVTAYLNTSRVQHSATLLPNGKLLVSGGYDNDGNDLNTAELYDPGTNPNLNLIDDARFLVQQHYVDFLNREPDAGGLNFWTNQIASCGGDEQCVELKRINVSAAFFLSIEFQETGYFVYRVHKAAHGNLPGSPVPIKFDEFRLEMFEVGQGVVVGKSGWEQILENNKQSYLGLYSDDPFDRFTSAFPSSMTPTDFVDALFANAGVTPSANDRSAAINEFGGSTMTTDISARDRTLRRVAENSTLKQQELNRAFVLMQYFGYLRRNPNDPPEPTLDFRGYDFWLNKLDRFHGNFVDAEMVKAFITSTEYRQRFGQP